MKTFSNSGKNLIVKVGDKEYKRYPVKTHFVTTSDKPEDIVSKYVLPIAKKGDIVVICQKIVSITQGKIVKKENLKVGFWAKFLSKFAKKTPYGFSVGNPLKMQVAINLAGLPRILFACLCSAITKIFGISGTFYRVAGHQISQIDGFYGEIFPQYSEIGILGPERCDEICDSLEKKYNFPFAIADINDLGGNILGVSQSLKGKEKLLLEILRDNPATQSNAQTPIIIIREHNV